MAILENWKQVSDAQEVAANSAGTSAQKYDIYLNSIQAHLNTLKTTWSEFLMNLGNSGAINTAVDLLNSFVGALDILINKTPVGTMVLTALTVAIGRFTIAKAVDGITKFASALGKLGTLDGNIFQKMVGAIGNLIGLTSTASAGLTTVAGAEAAAGAGATAAAGGVTSLGAALATIAPYAAVIAAVGAAIWGVVKIVDAAVTTDKELSERIEETKSNIQSSESAIQSYNEELQTNSERINEINDLKGTSDWNVSLSKEADTLEKQNELLRQKIELEKQRIQIENEKLWKDEKEQFDREYGKNKSDIVTRYTDDNGNALQVPYDEYLEGADLFQNKMRMNAQTITNYLNAVKEGNYEQAESFKDSAQTADTAIKEQIIALEEYRDKAEAAKDTDMVEYIDELIKIAGDMPSISGVGVTIAEEMGIATDATKEATDAVQSLEEQFKSLGGTSIVPNDMADMDSWLRSLSDTDLAKVQEVLLNCGDYAADLSNVLSHMSGADAAQTLVAVYNDFYGILADCTSAADEFNQALNTDYDAELASYGQMLDYALKSLDPNGEGVKNYEALDKALQGIGLSASATYKDVQKLYNQSKDYLYFDTEGQLVVDTQKFSDAIKKTIKDKETLGKYDEETNTLMINNAKELAAEMGLPEQEMHALLESLKSIYRITDQSSMTGLQVALQNITNAATEAQKSINKVTTGFQESVETKVDGSVKYTLKNLDYDESLSDSVNAAREQARANIVKELQQQKESLEVTAKEAGLTLDIQPTLNFEKPADNSQEEIQNMANALSATSAHLKSLIDDDFNFDIDVGTKIAEQVQSSLENAGDITISENTIQFNTDAAKEAYVNSLKDSFKGIDVGSIIQNMISSGITFTSTTGTGANAFAGVGDNIVQQIENSTSGKEIQIKSSIDDTMASQLNTTKDAANDMGDALKANANISLAGTSSNIQFLGKQADSAYGSVSSLSSALSALPSNKQVVLTYTYQQNGKAPAANGRQMPQYADGKNPANMGTPLRQETNSNSIVGEEGTEYVVHPDGTYNLVGTQGIEMVRLNKGDTVIPANVTKLIREGKLGTFEGGITSYTAVQRGTGGAHVVGSYETKYDTKKNNTKYTSPASASSSKSSSGSSSKSSSGSSSKSSSSSSSSSSSFSGTNEQAENELKALEHQRKMEYITEKQYAQKYEAIWKKYYKDVAEYRDKDYEMQEKLHDLQKTFFEDTISQLEEQVDMLERTSGTEQQQIAAYKKMQDLYHQRAEQYRKQGFSDDSPEIRELSKEWWTIQDQINEAQKSIFDNFIDDWEHAADIVDAKIELIPEVITQADENAAESLESLQNRLNSRLDQVMDLYKQKIAAINVQMAATQNRLNELYQQGYEKNKEQIKELEKQLLTYKKNILEIANDLKEEEISNREKEIDYQTQLKDAIKEYAQERSDAIQKEIDKLEEENDALDKQKEKKKLLDALDSAKNRNKRVYHADTGWVYFYRPYI